MDLKAAGVTPWMDTQDLLVGVNWKEGVRQAIKKSDYFLALISSNAIEKKGYYQTELNRTLDELRRFPPDIVYILPVRIDECIPRHEVQLEPRLRHTTTPSSFASSQFLSQP